MPRTLKQIRWTVEQAGSEFGIDRKTLTKHIKEKGVLPGDDGKFSTSDICVAIFSNLKLEQTEKTREEKLRLIRERLRDEKQLLPAAEVRLAFEKTALAVKTEILSSMHLLPDEKDSILKSLQASVESVFVELSNE